MNNYATIADYYVLHRDELVRFVASRLNDYVVAEDMVQDIFVRLLRSDRLINATTLPALAFTMARNMVTDRFRRRRILEEFEHYIKGADVDDNSMESVISAHELMERMERTLARLAPECREAYRLHIYAGMQVGQIAKETAQSYRAVEYRIGLARRAVRQSLRKVV